MWEGRAPIDNYSIGIEVVGYHGKEINEAQYGALRELLRQLKTLYKIPDKNVLTHSMIAYGRPNRFHPYKHRGRKRCGMIFARSDVRMKLGILAKPEVDLDVESGRLKVADPELFAYLYAHQTPEPAATSRVVNVISKQTTAWDIAREQYDSPLTLYVFPNGDRLPGDKIPNWGGIPPGTRVELPRGDISERFEGFQEIRAGETAQDVAGEAYDDHTTIYLFPSGMVRTGKALKSKRSTRRLLTNVPAGTKVLVGYIYGGHVKKDRLPGRIAGAKWNYPSTFYRFPDGRILGGDEIDPKSIPPNTLVLFQS
jgi:hypothetical protein